MHRMRAQTTVLQSRARTTSRRFMGLLASSAVRGDRSKISPSLFSAKSSQESTTQHSKQTVSLTKTAMLTHSVPDKTVFSSRDLHILYENVRNAQTLTVQRNCLAQILHGLPHLAHYKTMSFQSFTCLHDKTLVYFPTYEPRKGLHDVARAPLDVSTLSAYTEYVIHERGAYCLLHWGRRRSVTPPHNKVTPPHSKKVTQPHSKVKPPHIKKVKQPHSKVTPSPTVSRYDNINKHFVNDLFVRCFERLFRGRSMSTCRDTVVIDCSEAGTTNAMSRLSPVIRAAQSKPSVHTIINWDANIIEQARKHPHTSQCEFYTGPCGAYLASVTPRSVSAAFFDWCSSYVGNKCSPQHDLETAFTRHIFTHKESVLAFTVCGRTSSAKVRTHHDILKDVLQMASANGYAQTSLISYYNYSGGMRFFCFSVC